MRRALLIALLAALMVVAMVAGAAFAGEVNGHDGTETAAPSHANSICAFSGLNDHPDGIPSEQGPGGRTQSWGQDVKSGLYSPHDFTPGDACKGGSNPDRP